MRVILSRHACRRLRELRQEDIRPEDIVAAARRLPGFIPCATRFRGFVSRSGRPFDLVAKDIATGRLVITIIGQ
ncbi:MAG: hypothetical protein H5U00_03600 [Clostridia bacterium]|nr:hypothetical protein [Clostridia bacterium]